MRPYRWGRSGPRYLTPVLIAGGAVGAGRWVERALLDRWDRGERRDPGRSLAQAATETTVAIEDGAELRVLQWGDGPPIVLVHGITASAEDWLDIVPHLLAAGHRVLAVEQRGHGGSTLGSAPCDTARLAADLASVLVQLDLREVTLAGHSLGGYSSLALAGLHPDVARERVAALVLLGAPYTGRGLRELATLAAVAAPGTPQLQRSEPHGGLMMGFLAFGKDPDRHDVDELRYRWSRCDAATRRCFARHLAGEGITALLPGIELPAVVARGSKDHIVSARRSRTLARRLPHARSHTFVGAGHALLPEQPEAVARLILEAARPAR